jgi:Zn-dependent protease
MEILIKILAMFIPLVPAIALHEAAHGYVAARFGDRTAQMLGRLTLNPIKHIDPIGTLILPLALGLLSGGGFVFGWAKPVPVNTRNFRDPTRSMRYVSLAGPGSNLAQAAIWVVIAFVFSKLGLFSSSFVAMLVWYGIWWNVILMVLNMIPILPTDGGRVLHSFLPWKAAMQFQRIEPYGMWILIAILLTPVGNGIFRPFFRWTLEIYMNVTGVLPPIW